MSDLKAMYKKVNKDAFPPGMELSFVDGDQRQTLVYEKVEWTIDGDSKGLRYGENPDQRAALYRLKDGNLSLGDLAYIEPGRGLVSDLELLQSGKHPGKINLTDVDSALTILRYMGERPCAVIVKHNNPSGVAWADTLAAAYQKAYDADRIAAFGGAVCLNRPVDMECAKAIAASYSEVVAAPSFEAGTVELLKKRKNLRIIEIRAMDKLESYAFSQTIELKSLIDGGIIVQDSFVPSCRRSDDFLAAVSDYKGEHFSVDREPTKQELNDMVFGWLVEAGVTSNSVIYVKNGVTVGIGTGEQDRVGVAEIARDKAYKKRADYLCWKETGKSLAVLTDEERDVYLRRSAEDNGGLKGSVMISDAFFPFRDGIDVGLSQGVSAVLQPGGSLRDFESIMACNEYGAAMKFTGQRSFKH